MRRKEEKLKSKNKKYRKLEKEINILSTAKQ